MDVGTQLKAAVQPLIAAVMEHQEDEGECDAFDELDIPAAVAAVDSAVAALARDGES